MTDTMPTLATTGHESGGELHLWSVPLTHPQVQRIARDLSNRQNLHTAVMSLFPAPLPGPAGSRRASNAILFRLDTSHREPRLLIQSDALMERTDHGIAHTTLTGLLTRLTQGMSVRVQVDLNTVARGEDATGRPYTHPLTSDAIPGYALRKLSDGGLTDITVTDLATTVDPLGAHRKLQVTRVDALASVDDPARLTAAIRDGVGRARSYGCGLLTVLPA